MGRPNFVMAGASRCGTTSLCHYLSQHPDVLLSRPKEPLFFSLNYDRGLEYYWSAHFSHWAGERAVGEGSVGYQILPFVPARIRRDLPDARIIFSLRDPVERTFSHWWMHRWLGNEKLPFRKAIDTNLAALETGRTFAGAEGERLFLDRIAGKHLQIYLDTSYYAKNLRAWYDVFPAERIKVVLFEDLKANPGSVVRDLWSFLGVDSTVGLTRLVVENPGVSKRFQPIYSTARRLGLHKLIPENFGHRLKRLTVKFDSKPRLEPVDRAFLTDHFAAHNRELEELLGLDLSRWTWPENQG